jgi:outer membrane protein assembly factor BamB
MDHRGGYCLLMLDALTGESEQFATPASSGTPFASVLSSANRFYTHFGRTFMQFDPAKREFTFVHEAAPEMAMSMTEADDGTIWSVTHPQCGVTSYNPETGRLRDYGEVYTQNWRQYPRDIAVDDRGWVYFGIGRAASQMIIFDPDTGEATPVLGEDERINGRCPLWRYEDGKVYGKNGNQWYELYDGEARKIEDGPKADRKPIIEYGQGLFHQQFPTGHTLKDLDFENRVFTIETPEGEVITHEFDYESDGARLTGLQVASDGTICGGTAHPMRFFSYDPATDEMTNREAYGQWNTLASAERLFYVGGYGGGFLLEWDPHQAWVPTEEGNPDSNPRFLTEITPVVHRPHDLLVHPGGRHVILAGTPGYGSTGGGLLIWDRETETEEVLTHEQLVEHQSVTSLVALLDGNLLCATTVRAGTGGEVRADTAALFVLGLETGEVTWRAALGGVKTVRDTVLAASGVVYGLTEGGELLVFDPTTLTMVQRRDLTEQFGKVAPQQGQRFFVEGPDDRIFMLFERGIAELDTGTHTVTMLAESPMRIGPGGDYLDGRIYFGHGSHVYSWPIPDAE